MNNLIVLNFRFAMIVTIVGAFIQLWYVYAVPQVLEYLNDYQLVQATTKASPFAWFVLVVFGWYIGFKDNEGHAYAFFMGLIMLSMALGTFLAELVNGPFYSNIQQIFQLYIGMSCVLYSSLGLNKLV